VSRRCVSIRKQPRAGPTPRVAGSRTSVSARWVWIGNRRCRGAGETIRPVGSASVRHPWTEISAGMATLVAETNARHGLARLAQVSKRGQSARDGLEQADKPILRRVRTSVFRRGNCFVNR
jgi:hypothetical protein